MGHHRFGLHRAGAVTEPTHKESYGVFLFALVGFHVNSRLCVYEFVKFMRVIRTFTLAVKRRSYIRGSTLTNAGTPHVRVFVVDSSFLAGFFFPFSRDPSASSQHLRYYDASELCDFELISFLGHRR